MECTTHCWHDTDSAAYFVVVAVFTLSTLPVAKQISIYEPQAPELHHAYAMNGQCKPEGVDTSAQYHIPVARASFTIPP